MDAAECAGVSFFWWPNNPPLFHTVLWLSCLSADGHLRGFYFWLLWQMLLWIFMWTFFFNVNTDFQLQCLTSRIAGHMAFCICYWGIAKWFSIAAAPFHNATTKKWRQQFLYMLSNPDFALRTILALVGVVWCFMLVSPALHGWCHLPVCSRPFTSLHWRHSSLSLLPTLKYGWLLLRIFF